MRNYGTNVYSNNFEPQVNGVLDARTKIEGPASDLTLDSTWTSKDGKQWACEGLVVSVVNDPEDSKNGLYLLLDDDYSSTSNWKFIGSDVDLSSKQDVLVSGQNIKTINGNSLLGSGNLQIQGEGPSITVDDTLSTTSTNPVQNKVITEKINTKQDLLVSGTSIKTVNNTSLLGSGNISIPKGDKGDKGDPGAKGDAGTNGTNGITPTIGSNGNWFLGDEDTGKPSRGEKGDTPEVEELEKQLANKANKATTLSGYGISDAYTKEQVDSKVSSVYRVKGSVANFAALPKTAVIGDVYNLTDTGANYVCTKANPAEWDKLSENVDLSNCVASDEVSNIVYMTLAEYNDLSVKDSKTLYLIHE